jgi:hypothetical protein
LLVVHLRAKGGIPTACLESTDIRLPGRRQACELTIDFDPILIRQQDCLLMRAGQINVADVAVFRTSAGPGS